MLPRRLRRLECRPGGVFVVGTFLSRLLGLAFLDGLDREYALLIPRCSSVHTFGMRFALDITFLDRHGRELRTARNVPPCKLLRHRGAKQVLERQALPTSPRSR